MTILGFRFNGNNYMASGKFEPLETELVLRILDKSDILINIGANIGYYCCLALSKSKRVVAFEPMRNNLHYLMRNVQSNYWCDRFECFPLALAAQPGLIEIFGTGTSASLVGGWAGQTNSETIPASTLDIVLGDRFKDQDILIILDVEGAEYGVLSGAKKFLSLNKKPIWLVEIAISEHQPLEKHVNPYLVDTFNIFGEHGYVAISVENNPRIIDIKEIEEIALIGFHNFETTNFVFCAPDRVSDVLRKDRMTTLAG